MTTSSSSAAEKTLKTKIWKWVFIVCVILLISGSFLYFNYEENIVRKLGIEYREEALQTTYERLQNDWRLKNGVQPPILEGWSLENKE